MATCSLLSHRHTHRWSGAAPLTKPTFLSQYAVPSGGNTHGAFNRTYPAPQPLVSSCPLYPSGYRIKRLNTPVTCKAGAGSFLAAFLDHFDELHYEVLDFLHQAFQTGVLAASSQASFKLFLICALVGYLLRAGYLPASTAPVFSKVAFNLLAPCMLFTRVNKVIAGQANATMLILPLVAAAQIAVGSVLGWFAGRIVEGSFSKKFTVFGWHPLNPAPSATAIAASIGVATGIPQAAPALLPKVKPPPEGTRQMVMTACTFGNSLTLPLIFATSLLPAAVANKAIGYMALYMVAWSPLQWALGYAMITSGVAPKGLEDESEIEVHLRPGYKPGIEGLVQRLSFHASELLGKVKGVINPPIVGVILGVLVGSTRLGVIFNNPSTVASMNLPFELSVACGALICAFQVASMLADATWSVGAIVLGTSIFPKQTLSDDTDVIGARTIKPSLFRELWPKDRLEVAMLTAVALVRCLCLPVVTLLMLGAARSAGLLTGVDPVLQFVVLLEAAMPPAQNLVLLMQLHEPLQPLAPRMARLMLHIYAVAIVPITLWLTYFLMITIGA